MGVAVYGEKILEDEKKILYKYGMSKDSLHGMIEILKSPLKENSIKYNIINDVGFALLIIYSVVSFYKQNNYFPNKISRQS